MSKRWSFDPDESLAGESPQLLADTVEPHTLVSSK
jgi:hypothetical protein